MILHLSSLSNGEEFITTEQLQRCMRELVFPSTSNKLSNTRYVNGKNHLQKSLTEDSCDQDSPSDDESIHNLSNNKEDGGQDGAPGMQCIIFEISEIYIYFVIYLSFFKVEKTHLNVDNKIVYFLPKQIGQHIRVRRSQRQRWYPQRHHTHVAVCPWFHAYCASSTRRRWTSTRCRYSSDHSSIQSPR